MSNIRGDRLSEKYLMSNIMQLNDFECDNNQVTRNGIKSKCRHIPSKKRFRSGHCSQANPNTHSKFTVRIIRLNIWK